MNTLRISKAELVLNPFGPQKQTRDRAARILEVIFEAIATDGMRLQFHHRIR
ncbi:hypothetical protein [Iningainema tapete]|uniref:hypothetical protein n=1 Tax=Iningainema tapete TaxID=2806730 RepID=UPI001EE3432C|nr:hypothetical protein [Iningainema tapete]